mgnify:FL=1
MTHLRKSTGWGGLWKALVVFVIGGYTLTSVLAFDAQGSKTSEQEKATKTNAPEALHDQIENHVAFGVKQVWNNLVAFMQEGMETPSKVKTKEGKENWTQTGIFLPVKETGSKSVTKNDTQPIIRMNFPESESDFLPVFEDIWRDPQKESIEILASIGIVNWEEGKYHPLNHVRCSDFVRVIIDIYRYKHGYDLWSTKGLTDMQSLPVQTADTLLSKKLNTAKHLWFLEGVEMIRDHTITPVQAQLILNNIFTLYPHLGQKEKIKLIDTTKSVLTKSEMAGYLVAIFQLEPQETDNLFRDIHNHRYQDAIIQLAQLGVVAGRNGNFYPDNDTLRADGVIMIANSMLAKEQKALVIKNFYHLNSIADVTYFAAFAPHLEFLLDHKIGTTLLRHESSGDLFLPYALLTKWEAYSLVAKAAGIKILNPEWWSSTQAITRGELAQLLVEAFDFGDIHSSPSSEKDKKRLSDETDKKKSVLISLLKEVVNEL